MILSNTEYNIGGNIFFFFFPSFPSSSSSIKFVPSSMEASLPKIISPREEGQSRHLTKRSLFDTCLTSLSSISFFFPFFRAWKSSFLREYAVLEKMARVPFFRMWDNECKSVKFNGPGQRGEKELGHTISLKHMRLGLENIWISCSICTSTALNACMEAHKRWDFEDFFFAAAAACLGTLGV